MSDVDRNANKKAQNRLLNFFGVRSEKGKGVDSKEKIALAKKPKDVQAKNRAPRKLKLPSSFEKMWSWFIKNNYDSNQTLKERLIRYNDIDYAVLNSGILAMVMELYADEAVQADSQKRILIVESKDKKVKKEIERLLNYWGIDQPTLRTIAYNLTSYGDSFSINSTDGAKGITDVTHVDVRDIVEKLEFRFSKVPEMLRKSRKYSSTAQDKINALAKQLSNNKVPTSDLYKSYVLGYEVSMGEMLPPWNVSHFKIETTKSEFFPYGKSLMINSISSFRQYQTSKNLEAMLRAAKFPKEVYEVTTDPEASEMEAWEAVNLAKEEYLNVGMETKEKEDFAAGTQIWIPDGLLSFKYEESNINTDQIKDIELLRDEMIISTRIPKGYLITERGWGTSGQALLQQFKPFGRAVFSIQSIILKELAQMIRLHFIMTGQFEEELTEFTLGMNFPVIEESSDRIRAKNDSLRIASDIISNLQNALGTRDGLPPEVIKDIFTQYTFLDKEDVDDWIDKSAEALQMENEFLVNKELTEDTVKEIRKSITPDLLNEAYFTSLSENNIDEGQLGTRHFINSSCAISPRDRQILSDLRKVRSSKDRDIKG